MAKNKRGKFTRSRKPITWRQKLFRYFLVVILYFVTATSALVFLLSFVNPPTTPLMWIRWIEDGYPVQHTLVLKNWQPLKKISPNLILAAITAEDSRFFKHRGVDWRAAWAAFRHNINSSQKYGASTITMQTARNVFLWQKRNWFRKSLEIYFTLLMEFLWTKQRILEVYLNVIEWGNGIYGCDEAARAYYHRPPSKLSPIEAVRMVSILPNPRVWNLESLPKDVIRRQSRIMEETKFTWVPHIRK